MDPGGELTQTLRDLGKEEEDFPQRQNTQAPDWVGRLDDGNICQES